MTRVGLLGGTFDPPHIGHLVVARDAREALGLDEVRLVVSGRPPHKTADDVTPAATRLRMVEACVNPEEGDVTRLRACDLELERPGPSWTVDTVRELARLEPEVEWTLLLGADQLADFGSWREPEALGRLARIAVFARRGDDPGRIDPGVDVSYESVPVTRIDVSSSGIRERVRAGRSVRWLVTERVLDIVKNEGLYRRTTC